MFDFFKTLGRGTSAWRWVKCSDNMILSMGLPEKIPWPGEYPDPVHGEPLQLLQLIRGIDRAKADPATELDPIWGRVQPLSMASSMCTAAMRLKMLKMAGKLLNKMEANYPCPFVWMLRVEWYLRQERSNAKSESECLKNAFQLASKCTTACPKLASPWLHLARAYKANRQPKSAIQTLLTGLQHCPGNHPMQELLVALGHYYRFGPEPPTLGPSEHCWYVDKKGYKAAVAAQMQRAGTSVTDLVMVATDVKNHNFDPASEITVLRRILQLDPDHRTAQVQLAAFHISHGNLAEGKALLSVTQKSTNEEEEEEDADADTLFQQHQLALKEGDPEAANHLLDAALEADPNHQQALEARYVRNPALTNDEREKTLREFAVEQGSWRAARMAGFYANHRKDWHLAVSDVELAWKLNPDDLHCRIDYTQGLGSINEHEKVAALLQPDYKARRLPWQLKWPYALALHELGHPAEALKILDEMIRDKRLPKHEPARLMSQRDLWTGHSAFPSQEYNLQHEDNPERLAGGLILTHFNGEDTKDMGMLLKMAFRKLLKALLVVVPAGSRNDTSIELPVDELPPGTRELSLGLAQEARGAGRAIPVGTFHVRGIEPGKLRTERLFISFRYQRHGCMYFTARQGKRKLKVEWREPSVGNGC